MKSKYLNFFLEVAKSSAELSHAKRLQVGAVVFKDNRILSTGYNGTPSGSNNECETVEHINGGTVLKTKPEVIHAEENAIAFMAKEGIAAKNCSILITHAPCFECSKLIIQSGIKEVFYEVLYRDNGTVSFLQDNGVQVTQISEEKEENKYNRARWAHSFKKPGDS